MTPHSWLEVLNARRDEANLAGEGHAPPARAALNPAPPRELTVGVPVPGPDASDQAVQHFAAAVVNEIMRSLPVAPPAADTLSAPESPADVQTGPPEVPAAPGPAEAVQEPPG